MRLADDPEEPNSGVMALYVKRLPRQIFNPFLVGVPFPEHCESFSGRHPAEEDTMQQWGVASGGHEGRPSCWKHVPSLMCQKLLLADIKIEVFSAGLATLQSGKRIRKGRGKGGHS